MVYTCISIYWNALALLDKSLSGEFNSLTASVCIGSWFRWQLISSHWLYVLLLLDSLNRACEASIKISSDICTSAVRVSVSGRLTAVDFPTAVLAVCSVLFWPSSLHQLVLDLLQWKFQRLWRVERDDGAKEPPVSLRNSARPVHFNQIWIEILYLYDSAREVPFEWLWPFLKLS